MYDRTSRSGWSIVQPMRSLEMKCALLFSALLLVSSATAQEGHLDPSFDPGFGVSELGTVGSIKAIAEQPDGKLLVAGEFNQYDRIGRARIARIEADGSLDPTFFSGAGADGYIDDMVIQPDGRILISGSFHEYDGFSRPRIARLMPDGQLDESFDAGTGPSNTVGRMALQPDGKVLIIGTFQTVNGVPRRGVARLNADGSLDATYAVGTGVDGFVYTSALQPDGKLIISGSWATYNGTPNNGLVRINTDGSRDVTFQPPTAAADDRGYALTLRPDGKIFIGGTFSTYGTTARNGLALLNADGTLDTSFDPGGGTTMQVSALLVQPDGKLLVGGQFDVFNGAAHGRLVRLDLTGAVEATFNVGSGADGWVFAIVRDAAGRILASGAFNHVNGQSYNCIVRLHEDGALDPSFNTTPGPGMGEVLTATRSSDGTLVLGGRFNEYDAAPANRLVRIRPDGSREPTFDVGAGPDAVVQTITEQPDGRLIIAGEFNSFNGVSRGRIARLHADGTLDESFDPGTGITFIVGGVYSSALAADGKVLAGGLFYSFNGTSVNHLVRLNINGSVDPSLTTGTGPNNTVGIVKVQADGKILIGGHFTMFNGVARNRIARLNADGTLDTSFDIGTGANDLVKDIQPLPDGRYLVTGFFSEYRGVPCGGVVRVMPNGDIDPSFATSFPTGSVVLQANVQRDGRIVAVGYFAQFSGAPRRNVVRLLPNGTVDETFEPVEGANAGVVGFVPLPHGPIVLYGRFTFYDGVSRNGVVQIQNGIETGVEEGAPGMLLGAYPNPTTGLIQLPMSHANASIELIDAMGRSVMTVPYARTLDLSGAGKGAFVLVARGANGAILGRQRVVCQ